MKKENVPFFIMIISLILIILNIIITSHNINFGFWMRILSLVLLITAIYLSIQYRKNQPNQ